MINVLRLQCDGCAMFDTANVYKSRDEKQKYKQLTLSSLVFRHSHRSVFDRVPCTYNYCLIDGAGLETRPYRLHDELTEEKVACMASASSYCLPQVLLQLDIFFHHSGALAHLRTVASALSPFAARPGDRGCT